MRESNCPPPSQKSYHSLSELNIRHGRVQVSPNTLYYMAEQKYPERITSIAHAKTRIHSFRLSPSRPPLCVWPLLQRTPCWTGDVRWSHHGHDGLCLTTLGPRSGTKRRSWTVKRAGESLFRLLSGGMPHTPKELNMLIKRAAHHTKKILLFHGINV